MCLSQKIFPTITVLRRVIPHSTSENLWPYVSWLAKFVQCCFSSVWRQSAPALQPESYERGMYRCGISHLMSWTRKVSLWQLMDDFFQDDCIPGGNFITCCSDSLFCFFTLTKADFSSSSVFLRRQSIIRGVCERQGGRMLSVWFCLLTAEQLFCFLPVSCSAAECYRRADMSAFNRPRWSS